MSLDICIMAPDRVFLNTKVEEIILPTTTGQIGVLSNHSPLLTSLDIGIMLVRETTNWESIVLMGGFALIKDNKVTILVTDVENASSINRTEAENLFTTARVAVEKAVTEKEKIETNILLRRAKVRFLSTQM